MFISPWSGQSDLPASGGARARVELTFSRTLRLQEPLVLETGFQVQEEQIDWGENGGVVAETGRIFLLEQPLVFAPGEMGPKTVWAIAEKDGYGYNNPLPDSLTGVVEFGADFNNTAISVTSGIQSLLTLGMEPDVLLPSQLGYYIQFTNGANDNKASRIIGYAPPSVGVHGGEILLDTPFSPAVTPTGTFTDGEAIEIRTGGTGGAIQGTGILLLGPTSVHGESLMVYQLISGTPAALTDAVMGLTSGASAIVGRIAYASTITTQAVPDWEVVSFTTGYGLVVTNTLSPTGGDNAWLDEIGRGRGIDRAGGELDASYRTRVAEIADVVAPNALIRAVNRILAPLGSRACFREAGDMNKLAGLYFDAGSSQDAVQDPATNFAFDIDPTLTPTDEWKVLFSVREMRGFFLMGVPDMSQNIFGAAFDGAIGDIFPIENALDTTAVDEQFACFDGENNNQSEVYASIWAALDRCKAGGVSFDIYIESNGCV
jgi:hypothetical protein